MKVLFERFWPRFPVLFSACSICRRMLRRMHVVTFNGFFNRRDLREEIDRMIDGSDRLCLALGEVRGLLGMLGR